MRFGSSGKFTIKENSNARDLALFALHKITEENRKSNSILKEIFDQASAENWKIDKTDRAFTECLVIGVLDRLLTIDTVIGRFSSRPVKRMKPLIRDILRLGTYQILYMDRVPPSAACNESVKLVRLHGMEGLSGFVNGILRSITRDFEAGGDDTHWFDKIHEKYSVPEWLSDRLTADYGEEKAVSILEAFLCTRSEGVRFNISKAPEAEILKELEAEGLVLDRIDYGKLIADNDLTAPEGELPVVYELKQGGDVSSTAAFRKGLVTVQDPSSALVAAYASAALDKSKASYIIDVCAAPGGKSMSVADALLAAGNSSFMIEARDVSEAKTALIRENIQRCGFADRIRISIADALGSELDEDSFYRADLVLADLPCSGIGVIAKKPDIKLNIEEYTINELRGLQRDMLANVSRFVKPRGRLIYSTCTITREENEYNAEWIQSNLGFWLLSSNLVLPSDKCDGFYIAVFEKRY